MMLGGTGAVIGLVAASRVPEIGVRLALGAGARQVLWAVLGRPCAAAAVGVAIGMAAAAAAAVLLGNQFNGLPPLDAVTSVLVIALVAASVASACAAPAIRALRIDPATALRQQ
jgi:ABC-type antimicrobial peptide transport system permease subunit